MKTGKYKKEIGKKAEDIAVKYLEQKGFKILERNYRKRFGEIDIICEKEGGIIFVEVRSLKSDFLRNPAESINFKKCEKIKKLAEEYIFSRNLNPEFVRFDVIAIFYPEKIYHYEDAFR